MAYELLSGHRPFENDSPTLEAAAHAHAPVPSIAERCEHLPPALDPVFRRALAKDPAARFGSAREFVSALREALFPARPRQRCCLPPGRPAAPRRDGECPRRVLIPVGAAPRSRGRRSRDRGSSSRAAMTRRRRYARSPAPRGTTTVQQTVTQEPAPPPPPPPPPPPATAAGSSGHTLNDRGYRCSSAATTPARCRSFSRPSGSCGAPGRADLYEGYANYNLGYTLYRLGRCPEAVTYLEPGGAARARPARADAAPQARRALLAEPLGVLLLVVRAVVAGLDRLPPVAVVAVPGDRLGQAVRERARRRPAERPELRGVQRVAAIVPGAVLDVTDERLVGAGQLEDRPRQVAVLDLLAAADVVDLTARSLRAARARSRRSGPRRGASRASGGRRRKAAAARRRARW